VCMLEQLTQFYVGHYVGHGSSSSSVNMGVKAEPLCLVMVN